MKNLTLILSTIIIFTAIASCGNKIEEKVNELETKNASIEELERMLILIEDFTVFAHAAAEDNILESDEIKEYQKRFEEIETIEKELLEKIDMEKDAQKEFDEYAEINNEKIDRIYEDFSSALEEIFACEGADGLF